MCLLVLIIEYTISGIRTLDGGYEVLGLEIDVHGFRRFPLSIPSDS